jgi:hypothetical protein
MGTPTGSGSDETELDAASAARMALLESSGAFSVLQLDKNAEKQLELMRHALRKSRHCAAELCQFVLLQVRNVDNPTPPFLSTWLALFATLLRQLCQ